MRAYLIAGDGAEPGIGAADALVIDGRTGREPPSLRAAGEAIQGRRADGPSAALDRFAALAMTRESEGRATRLLLHVDGVCSPDLDAGLAAAALLRPDAIVLPASHGRDVAHLGARLAVLEAEHGLADGSIGVVALLADAAGVLAAGSFAAASPRLRGLGWDAEGLAAGLGLTRGWDGPTGGSPVLAQARATVRLAAAAAGVEAIEAAYRSADAQGFSAHVAAARRDGFGAMFATNPAQARSIRITA